MLDNFILLAFDLVLLTIYTFVGLGIFLTIQLITYRVFHKNPYKWLMKKLKV